MFPSSIFVVAGASTTAVAIGYVVADVPLPLSAWIAGLVVLLGGAAVVTYVRRHHYSSGEWAIATTIVLLPVTPLVDALTGHGTPTRLALAAWVSWAAIVSWRSHSAMPQRITVALIAIVVLLAGSALVAANSGYGLVRLANWLMFVPAAFVSVSAKGDRLLAHSGFLLLVLLVGGAVLQFGGVIEGSWGGLALEGGENALRLTSVVFNPNDLGLLAAVIAAGGVAYASTMTGRAQAVAYLAAAAALGLVLASGSRGAMIAVLSTALVVARGFGNARALVAIAGIAALLIAVVASAPSISSSSAERAVTSLPDAVRGADASAAAREERWSTLVGAPGNVLLGNGFGGYASALGLGDVVLSTDAPTGRLLTVDNAWLKLTLESGVVSAAALGLVLLWGAYTGYRSLRSARFLAVVAVALCGGLAVRGLTADVFDINPWNFYLWLGTGIASSLRSRTDQ